jgi:hypothetical protein
MVFVLVSCGTVSPGVPRELPETAKAVCSLYQNTKPKVVAFRAWAVANWDAKVPGTDVPVISAEVKTTLVEFDRRLPQIDAAGKVICGFAEATSVTTNGTGVREKLKNVPWDKVLAVTVKAVDLAIKYQGKG